MFNKSLSELTLANDLANSIFSNIRGDSFNGDRSFVATLRALLLPRVGEDNIRLVVNTSTFPRRTIDGANTPDLVHATVGNLKSGLIIVHNVRSSNSDDRLALFERFDSEDRGFVKSNPDFQEMTDIRAFMAPVLNARFYTNIREHITVILVESLNTRKWHYVESFIPRYFKWYFDAAPITAEEQFLAASLVKRSSEDYERIIEEFAGKFDMRSYAIKNILGEIEKNARREQLSNIDRRINEIRQRIEEYEDQYRGMIRDLDNYNTQRVGIAEILRSGTDESELIDYFMSNKSLEPLRSNGSSFDFNVLTYVDTWDPELCEKAMNNWKSSFYHDYYIQNTIFEPKENRKKFFEAIFSDDPILKLKVCGFYRLDLRGTSTSERNHMYPESCRDYMPNPHLQKFNCLGNHTPAINSYLREGNTIGAVEQCMASCKSLNLTEPQTYTYLFEKLFATGAKVIELPDHTSVSPVDAMQWLLDRDNTADKEEK